MSVSTPDAAENRGLRKTRTSIVGAFASPWTPGTAYVQLHHCFGEVNGKKGVWGHALGGMGEVPEWTEVYKRGMPYLQGTLPDGIVVANNLMAFGAMRTLLRSRLRIPRDLAFIGVDDTIWTDTIKPSVSVVSQPTTTMGRETVRLLMRRIQDGASRRGEMVVLPAGLVLRESTEGEA